MTGRRSPWLLLWLVPAVALVLFAISFLSTLGHSGQRLAGTNSVALLSPVIEIGGGAELCQSSLAPRDATSLDIFVVPTGPTGPPVEVDISRPGQRLSSGRIDGGWTGGVIRVPISRIRESAADGRICVRNGGKEPLGFSGISSEVLNATVDGEVQHVAFTVLYYRDGSESWWDLLPTIAHRAGVLKGALSGAWNFWLALALVGLASAAALVVVVREGRREP